MYSRMFSSYLTRSDATAYCAHHTSAPSLSHAPLSLPVMRLVIPAEMLEKRSPCMRHVIKHSIMGPACGTGSAHEWIEARLLLDGARDHGPFGAWGALDRPL